MISEKFTRKIVELGNDKTGLIVCMNALDEEKRSIRSFMRKYSNEPKEKGGGSGQERNKKLRRLKDRLGSLVEEREYVRLKLGQIKSTEKVLNKSASRKIEFCHAFLAAAEINLSEEQFLELEAKAMSMLVK